MAGGQMIQETAVPKRSRRGAPLHDVGGKESWPGLALEGMADAVIVTDNRGRVMAMNAAAEDLTGASRSSSLGRPHGELFRLRDETGALESPVETVLAGGNVVELAAGAVLVREDGTERSIEGRAAPMLKGCERAGVVMTLRDAAGRQPELVEMLKLVDALRQTLKLQERFTSILGHDLKTPLGAIVMSAQLMLRNGSTGSATAPARILQCGRKMSKMIDQLLDFTRLQSESGIAIRLAPGNLGNTCRALLEELQREHGGRAVRMDMAGDLEGEWDGERLRQVVTIVVGNALQHGDPGGTVSVRVDGSAPEWVVLKVENAGEVPSVMLPILFDPFRNVQVPRPKAQGLGLGLYVSRRIVERHGGSLVVSSAQGVTEAVVRLPRRSVALSPHA